MNSIAVTADRSEVTVVEEQNSVVVTSPEDGSPSIKVLVADDSGSTCIALPAYGAVGVCVTESAATFSVISAPVNTTIVEVVTEGPQGPSGVDAGALPTGGDPGNILIKNSYSNYDTSWVPTLDGGTFF